MHYFYGVCLDSTLFLSSLCFNMVLLDIILKCWNEIN